jgi:DNA-binding transcriptional MocR family regulator
MSVRVSTWAWKQPIGGSVKLVLLALADQANDAGSCWPAQSTLAAKCGVSERTLQTHLAALQAAGYLARERRHRSNGTRTSDLYLLALDADLAGSGRDEAQISRDLPAKFDATKAQHLRAVKEEEPSKEPSGNRSRHAQLEKAMR